MFVCCCLCAGADDDGAGVARCGLRGFSVQLATALHHGEQGDARAAYLLGIRYALDVQAYATTARLRAGSSVKPNSVTGGAVQLGVVCDRARRRARARQSANWFRLSAEQGLADTTRHRDPVRIRDWCPTRPAQSSRVVGKAAA